MPPQSLAGPHLYTSNWLHIAGGLHQARVTRRLTCILRDGNRLAFYWRKRGEMAGVPTFFALAGRTKRVTGARTEPLLPRKGAAKLMTDSGPKIVVQKRVICCI